MFELVEFVVYIHYKVRRQGKGLNFGAHQRKHFQKLSGNHLLMESLM